MSQQHYTEKAKAEQEALAWLVRYKDKNNIRLLTTESPSEYSSFDNWINSGTTEYIAEIKLRKDISGNQVDKWGGPMFEFSKHSGVIAYKEKFNHTNEMIYINFFSDEVRIYKIRKDPTYYSWFLKKLPRNNLDKQLVWKYVVNLTEEDLIETIKYKNT
jgi:hypothetical protein